MNQTLQRLLIFFLVVILLYVLRPVIMPVLFAVLFATMVSPVVNFLERKAHFPMSISAVAGVLIFIGVVAGVVILIASQFSSVMENSTLYIEKFSQIVNESIRYIEKSTSVEVPQNVQDPQLSAIMEKTGGTLKQILSATSQFLGDLILVPVYMFFILFYRSFLVEFLYRAFASVENERMTNIMTGLYQVVQNYFRGVIIVMGIVGTLNTIGLMILGIENAIFFGFLAALLLLVPYIGIFIGSLLPALVALATKDSVWYSVGVVAIFAFIQILEANVITPNITGGKISMNALISILSLFLFGLLWGMPGLVLALPFTAMLKVIFDNSESMKAWGFLIGETESYHTRRNTMTWMRLKMKYFGNKK